MLKRNASARESMKKAQREEVEYNIQRKDGDEEIKLQSDDVQGMTRDQIDQAQ